MQTQHRQASKTAPLGAFTHRASEATKPVGGWPFSPPPNLYSLEWLQWAAPSPRHHCPHSLTQLIYFIEKGQGGGEIPCPSFSRHHCFNRHTPGSVPRSPQQRTVPSGMGRKWAPSRFIKVERNRFSGCRHFALGCVSLTSRPMSPPCGCRALAMPALSPRNFLFVYFKPTALPFSETGFPPPPPKGDVKIV